MFLSQKLCSLDEAKKKKIETRLQENYPNSVEVQVLLIPGVLEWIESQPWESTDASVAAHSALKTIITMLQEKNAYTTDKPIELVNQLLQIYNQMNEWVDSEAATSLDNTAHSSNTNDDVTCTEDQSFDFEKNLESLETLLKENDGHIIVIQQKLKEQEQLYFSQTNLENEKLKTTNDSSLTQQDKPLFENISVLVSTITSQISEWNYNKQQAQVGWPVFSSSDFLQPLIPVCQKIVEILSSTRSQAGKLLDIFTKIGGNKESLMQVQNMKNVSRSMLSSFLKSCFVVEKQPPPTQLIDKASSVSLRLLLGSQVLSSVHTPTVTCSLHLDDDIRRFHQANFENAKAQEENIKNVKNNKKVLTYDKETDSFSVSFDKLKLNKLEKRKTKLYEDKTKLVTDQKSCLMFQTQITIGTESFTIEAFSVPIVVMTNTSQCLESEATIFWDNAFGHKNREPFLSPNKVLLKDFLEALNQRWTKSNERELEDYHRIYLARKLFPDIDVDDFSKYYVTKQMFNKEHMKLGHGTFKFTFWSWFYKAMKLVKEFLFDEWRDNKIYGFVDKGEAEAKLNECLVGTFLLRFSDSVPGGITIAYKENMQVPGCNHVKPWMKEELKQKSLSDSLRDLQYHKDLQCLQYLYPSIPKDQAFGLYYSQTDETNSETFNPRYPKKAPIRVVRHDDFGSTSASNFSSNQSSSFQNMSSSPSVARMSESSNNNEQAFSPLPLDHDPLLSQVSHQDPLDMFHIRMDEEDDDFIFS